MRKRHKAEAPVDEEDSVNHVSEEDPMEEPIHEEPQNAEEKRIAKIVTRVMAVGFRAAIEALQEEVEILSS